MSEFEKPFNGPDLPPSVKQKDVSYVIDDEPGDISDLGKYNFDIEIKPVKRIKSKRVSQWNRLLQNYPELIGLSGMPLLLMCQRIRNSAMSKQMEELNKRERFKRGDK